MKYIASLLIVLFAFGFITSTQGYFDALSFKAEKTVFAYQDNSGNRNVQAKPIDRSGSTADMKEDIEIRLMTYNIHRGIGKNGNLDLDSTAKVIREADPGIVALQEVERFSFRTGFKDQIKYLASELGMNYAYGKSLNILTGEYGNALLSRYPIEEYSTYNLPSMGEQRTILRMIVNINGYRLAVYDTHLGLNKAEREEQLNYILQLLDSEKIDYVVMGDMNTGVDKLSKITKVMRDSAKDSQKYNQSTFEEKDVSERIDYILLSRNMKADNYDVVISEASDHYPAVSDVKIAR